MERKFAKYLILISLVFFTSQIFSQSQIKLLERAYEEDSDSLMKIFFENWKKDLPVYKLNENYLDDTLNSAIELYKFFNEKYSYATSNYNLLPADFCVNIHERIGFFHWTEDSTWNDYYPENERRDTLRPPEMAYYRNGQLLQLIKLRNFLPIYNNGRNLFLDSNYTGILNYFLLGNFRKEQFTRFEKNNLKRTEQEFQKRFSFLTDYLSIHFTGGRVVFTDDNGVEIYSRGEGLLIGRYHTFRNITFDRTLKFAIVVISEDSQSTTYYMEKTSVGWLLKKKSVMYI